MSPAQGRPALTTVTIGATPEVTTSGSPAPHDRVAAMELVRVFADHIEMRRLIPRTNTAFHIENKTSQPRTIEFAGSTQTVTTPAVGPGQTLFFQIDLLDRQYRVRLAGRNDRGVTVRTYVPGQPPHRR